MFKDILRGMWLLLKADGRHLNPAVWTRGIFWLYGPNGVLRRLRSRWNEFFRDDFHPWNHDNQPLIDAWKAQGESRLTEGEGALVLQ